MAERRWSVVFSPGTPGMSGQRTCGSRSNVSTPGYDRHMNTLAIVVTYNDKNSVLECVDSLVRQADVLVWDNASTDGTTDEVRRTFPQAEVHLAPQNMLWTPALNAATELYWNGTQNLLYSNNDVIYEANVVSVLEQVLEDPQVGLAGPAGSGLGSAQDFAVWYGPHAPGWGGPPNDQFRRYLTTLPTKRVPHLVGASMMVQPSLREEIGPLDDSMPLGADDHDYCIRAKEAGYSIQVAYSAFVRHKSHASMRVARNAWNENGERSWNAFNAKWAGYFHDEEEAIKVQWGDTYYPGWDVGTGWLPQADREEVYELRRRLASVEEMPPV